MRLVTWLDLNMLKRLSNTINVLGVASDVAIAGGLFYHLHNSRTGFQKSDTMIRKLIAFSVSTGLLTSVCAIASLVSNLVWGNTMIYVTFYFCLGRLYSNSLLATLNARNSIRGESDENDSGSFSLQTFPVESRVRNLKVPKPPSTNITIKIDTTQEMVRDSDRAEKLDTN
ncbi:hypothetical protein PM082_005006 [Marasmius tenuissimus]|nr:hypothetical protein PM082_005006 [Marasmius tenuissimus]